ncbi:MAG: hypothetical protein WAK20_16260 [Candidatus Acidiferrum sp.]
MMLANGVKKLVLVGIVSWALVPVGSVARAQNRDVSGEYECTEAKVAGKSVPCKAAQLFLKRDGRFEVQGREGQYMVTGSWVELSGTLPRSRAKIEEGHRIVFRFYNKKGLCEVIYERRVAELGKTNLG